MGAKGEAGRAGTRSGVPAAATASAHTTIRRASSILKALSPDGRASVSAASAARRKQSGLGRISASAASAARARHGIARQAAQRQPRLHDDPVLDAQAGCGGDHGEGVGGTLAQAGFTRRAVAPSRRQWRSRAWLVVTVNGSEPPQWVEPGGLILVTRCCFDPRRLDYRSKRTLE
jgi:hypothetical protein